MHGVKAQYMNVIALDDVVKSIGSVCKDNGYNYCIMTSIEGFIWSQFTGHGVILLDDLLDAMKEVTVEAEFAIEEVIATTKVMRDLRICFPNSRRTLVIRNW
jgi:hypothetical protein